MSLLDLDRRQLAAIVREMDIPRCGAKTRQGGLCRNAAMLNGSGRCRLHGGKSLRGPEHPNWKHGRYAKGSITSPEPTPAPAPGAAPPDRL